MSKTPTVPGQYGVAKKAPDEAIRARAQLGPQAGSQAQVQARPYVIGQLGQSLDGRIATRSGHSHHINGASGLDYLHGLRADVDAVIVGIGTVIADDPRLTVRRVAGPNPARVVIDPRGRLPDTARCLTEDGCDVLVVSQPGVSVPARATPLALEACEGVLAPEQVLSALGALGYGRVLVEGGAATLSHFINCGLVDRLDLITAPVIIGSGKPGLSLAPVDKLCDAMRPVVDVVPLKEAEVVFRCFLSREAALPAEVRAANGV